MTEPRPFFVRLLAGFMMLIGIGAIVGAIQSAAQAGLFLARAERAEGQILRIVESGSGRTRRSDPLYTFRDASGRAWEGMGDYSIEAHFVGQKVPILFNPKNPAESAIEGYWKVWLLSAACLVFGLAFGASGWRRWKNSRLQEPAA